MISYKRIAIWAIATFLLVLPFTVFAADVHANVNSAPLSPIQSGDDDHGEEDDHAEDEESHADDEDDHADEDSHGHSEPAGPLSAAMPLIGGLIGAALLAGLGSFWQSGRFGILTWIGLALIGLTGLLHLVVGFQWSDTLLILNGIGFVGLGLLWIWPQQFIPNQRKIVGGVLIAYTIITFVGYFVTHDHYDFVAIFSKIVEALLVIVLALSFNTNEGMNERA